MLIIGGSKHYHGSPVFNAMAALRSGVDLATVLAPQRAADIIATFAPDIIAYPLKGDFLRMEHLKTMLGFAKNKDAVVIGGGLCRRKETLSVVKIFLKKVRIPCVIDADAIYALNKNVMRKSFLVTPHAYEFFILTGKKVMANMNERLKTVRQEAQKLGATIVLKGHVDIISDGKKTALNRTGDPKMTVGGTGDILAGICGALLARKVDIFDAACAAAYISGEAGELAVKKFGESTIASDVLEEIPNVVNVIK